jgi:signal transduction histidine kinase
MLLASVLPLLALGYVLALVFLQRELEPMLVLPLAIVVPVLVTLGFVILSKYPANIGKLRRYLGILASGGVPRDVQLAQDEEDLATIRECVSEIVEQTEQRIRKIEDQSRTLVEAERQRVMIESLGAACHHLAQPVTVMTAYLEMMKEKKKGLPEDTRTMVDKCQDAADAMGDILQRLREVAEYRTEAYVTLDGQTEEDASDRILKI